MDKMDKTDKKGRKEWIKKGREEGRSRVGEIKGMIMAVEGENGKKS